MTLRPEITAADIMQSQVETVGADVPLPELEYRLVCSGIQGAPVVDGEALVGVVSRSDIVEVLTTEQEFGELVGEWYVDSAASSEPSDDRTKELHARVGQRLQGMRVRDIMNPDVISVSPAATADEVARTMIKLGVHRVLVTSERNLLGIITTMDMLRLLVDDIPTDDG